VRLPTVHRSRRWAGIALGAAALVAVLAMLLGGLRFTVLNDKRFSDSVAASLSKPQVARFVGERTATQLVNVRPQLQGLGPLIASTMTAVSKSRQVRSLVRVAASQFQRIVIGGDRNAATLVVANLAVFITEALKSLRPEVAARIPGNLAVSMASLKSGGAGAAINDIGHTAQQLRAGMWVAIGLALALVALSVALAVDRARTVQRAGFALAGAGIVAAGLFGLAVVALPAGLDDADARAAARAVLSSVLGPAIRLDLGIALAGAIAGVCARSVIEKERLDLLARRVALRMWRGPLTRSLIAFVIGGFGLLLLVSPLSGLKLAAMLGGVGLMLFGLELLARSLIEFGSEMDPSPQELIAGTVARVDRRKALRGGGLALLLILAVGFMTSEATLAPAAPTDECNGLKVLCQRRLDQVVFAATHNSMGASQRGFLFANHRTGIDAQLAGGVRGLLIDTHLGVRTARGIYTELATDQKSRNKLEKTIGPQATKTAETVRAQLGFRGGGSPEIYLCHGFCEIGATLALTQFESIRDFLVTHPGEVLLFSVEDQVPPQMFAQVVKQSGLLPFVWQGSVEPLPTLGQMVESGQRVLFMVEEDPGNVPWLHRQFQIAQETPYNFKTTEELLGPKGCDSYRGGTTPPLFLINQFIEEATPSTAAAATLNEPGTLEAHARSCAARRDRIPTLLAVDQWQIGDVVGAARELNEHPPALGGGQP
jgi:hypothetical protein